MNELEVIQSTQILNKDDFTYLASIANELRDTMEKRQMFRTETEMYISVLNDIKHPTPASKYWQAVREQSSMFESLLAVSFEYRRNEVKIERLNQQMQNQVDPLDIKETQIDLDECYFKRARMESEAKDRIREIKLWSRIKSELDDNSFDTQDVNNHQLVSYTRRFILQAYNAPKDMPVAEANNLRGQLATAVKELQQRGVLEEVLQGLPAPVVQKTLADSGVSLLTNKV